MLKCPVCLIKKNSEFVCSDCIQEEVYEGRQALQQVHHERCQIEQHITTILQNQQSTTTSSRSVRNPTTEHIARLKLQIAHEAKALQQEQEEALSTRGRVFRRRKELGQVLQKLINERRRVDSSKQNLKTQEIYYKQVLSDLSIYRWKMVKSLFSLACFTIETIGDASTSIAGNNPNNPNNL